MRVSAWVTASMMRFASGPSTRAALPVADVEGVGGPVPLGGDAGQVDGEPEVEEGPGERVQEPHPVGGEDVDHAVVAGAVVVDDHLGGHARERPGRAAARP